MFNKSALMGYHGSKFKKLAMLFGVTEAYGIAYANAALTAGQVVVQTAAIAAGKLVVINNIAWRYVGTVPTEVYIQAYTAALTLLVYGQLAPVSNQLYDRQTFIVIPETGYLRIVIEGATLNDDFYLSAIGFSMDVG